jgi:hypothetical protein
MKEAKCFGRFEPGLSLAFECVFYLSGLRFIQFYQRMPNIGKFIASQKVGSMRGNSSVPVMSGFFVLQLFYMIPEPLTMNSLLAFSKRHHANEVAFMEYCRRYNMDKLSRQGFGIHIIKEKTFDFDSDTLPGFEVDMVLLLIFQQSTIFSHGDSHFRPVYDITGAGDHSGPAIGKLHVGSWGIDTNKGDKSTEQTGMKGSCIVDHQRKGMLWIHGLFVWADRGEGLEDITDL